VGAKAPDSSASCQYNSLALPCFPCFFHKLIIFLFTSSSSSQSTTTNLQSPREGGDGIEEPTTVEARTKGGRRRQKPPSEEVREGEEPAAKDVDEEPLFDDTMLAVELLRSTFRKLEGVGEAFDIKAHHDVYKDPSVKGLAFRIHGLAEKLENLPVVKRAGHCHFIFDDGGSDGDDGSHSDDGSHEGDDGSHRGDGGTPTNC
jgi:hypothetical protein